VAIIRIDPPKKPGGGLLAAVRGVTQFYANPLGTIVGAADRSHSTSEEAKETYGTLPLEIDTATGLVQFQRMPDAKGRGQLVVNQRNAAGADAQRVLQQVYDTGVLPSKIPVGYLAAAKIVQQLHTTDPPEYLANFQHAIDQDVADKAAAAQTGVRNNPPFPVWESDNMGILIPPGGMAGFSQMTGASKLALTRGSRRSSGGGRKRRRKSAKRTKTRKTRSKTRKSKKRLVKGSAAAKKYMASIRRKRRK
jgi:hypothetical protein